MACLNYRNYFFQQRSQISCMTICLVCQKSVRLTSYIVTSSSWRHDKWPTFQTIDYIGMRELLGGHRRSIIYWPVTLTPNTFIILVICPKFSFSLSFFLSSSHSASLFVCFCASGYSIYNIFADWVWVSLFLDRSSRNWLPIILYNRHLWGIPDALW